MILNVPAPIPHTMQSGRCFEAIRAIRCVLGVKPQQNEVDVAELLEHLLVGWLIENPETAPVTTQCWEVL